MNSCKNIGIILYTYIQCVYANKFCGRRGLPIKYNVENAFSSRPTAARRGNGASVSVYRYTHLRDIIIERERGGSSVQK